MIATVPKSIQADDEEVSQMAHALYQEILECVKSIDTTFETLSRVIYKFVQEPRLVEAMGWESPQDIFNEPEIKEHIERMKISSRSQFFRWKQWASLDAERPDLHLLRLDNLSRLSQNGKAKAIKAVIDKGLPKEEELDELMSILEENPRAAVVIENDRFAIKNGVGMWDGKPAIRFIGDDVAMLKLMARLLPSYGYKYYDDTSTVVSFRNDDGKKSGVVLTKDVDFLEFLGRKLRIKI